MKKYLFLIVSLLLLFSCEKEIVSIEDQLTGSSSGWRIQYYSVLRDQISNSLYNQVIRHYKDVGKLVFNDNNTGYHIYDDQVTSFIWFISKDGYNTDIINFEIESTLISNCESPFLYYYFSGQEGSPFYHFSEDEIHTYEISFINPFTVQFRFSSSGYSSFDNFGSLEFVATAN